MAWATTPSVPGILTTAQVRATANAIVATQLPSGAIPWYPGGPTDPWDHVQAAMGLSVAGRHAEAVLAYEWLRCRQYSDGTWPATFQDDHPTADHVDWNFCAYPATGVWHHWRVTGDDRFRRRMWPMVRRAMDALVAVQSPAGPFPWARDREGALTEEYLLTGNASIRLSLRCAIALADLAGVPVPTWVAAEKRLRHAVAEHPEWFSPRSRYSMDWYYPMLTGAVTPTQAMTRIDQRWADFVVPGLGVRCVDDHPWVTGAETCELVLALVAVGQPDRAATLLSAIQHLRDDTGHYWTGLVFADGKRWPVEVSTWTAGTVLLAVDALSQTTTGSGLFRGDGLPVDEPEEVCTCQAS